MTSIIPPRAEVEALLRDELQKIKADMLHGVTDLAQQKAIADMASDLAAMPMRLLRGEDVSSLMASLKAESLNRSLDVRTRAHMAAQEAWARMVNRVLMLILSAALA